MLSLLGRFSDGLALLETAHTAFDTAVENEGQIGSALVTLGRGITELNRVYDDLDMAIPKAPPAGAGPKEEPAS